MDFDAFDVTLDEFLPTPVQPLMAIQLAKVRIAPITTIADRVHSTPEQLALGPGAQTIVVMTDARINNDLTLAEVVDPAEHAELFPDWEDRLLKSWVLTRWTSIEDHDDQYLGWFERARLIPCTPEQREEVWAMFLTQDEVKADTVSFPEWLTELIRVQMDQVAATDPDKVAVAVQCQLCGSRDVELHGRRVQRMACEVGTRLIDGEEHYVNTSNPQVDGHVDYHLHCSACEAMAEVDEKVVTIKSLS